MELTEYYGTYRHMLKLPIMIYALTALLLLATLVFGKTTVDIQLTDAYYAVNLKFLTIPAMLVLLTQGVVCSRAIRKGRIPNTYLALFYLTGTVVSVVGIAFNVFESYMRNNSKMYYTWTEIEPDWLMGFAFLYLLSQFGFLLSILLTRRSA